MTNENLSTDNIVYEDDIQVTMRGVTDSVGLPYTVNPVELVDRQALIELREGPPGPPGREGDPAWPWLWQGDIADRAALAALKVTKADARKAWRVVAENAIFYWTGLEFIAFRDAFRRPGRKGTPNRLTGSAVAGATGTSASARITGTAPNQHLEITFPRGATGDVGDPGVGGRIQDAADVLIDETTPLGQDYVLAWDAATGKFRPTSTPRRSGPWAIAGRQFAGGQNLNEPEKVLAAMTIPAQPVAWRPIVDGAILLASAVGTTKCDIEVRIGSKDGDLVGHGYGHYDTRLGVVMVRTAYQAALKPGSTVSVVPANQTTTLYVIVRRVVGSGNYHVSTDNSQMIVYAQPV